MRGVAMGSFKHAGCFPRVIVDDGDGPLLILVGDLKTRAV